MTTDEKDKRKLITIEDIVQQTGLSRRTIDRLIKEEKTFPEPVWIRARAHYPQVEVDEYFFVQQRQRSPDDKK